MDLGFAKRYQENYNKIYKSVFGREPEPFGYNNPSPLARAKACDFPKYDFYEDLKYKVLQSAKGCPLCGQAIKVVRDNVCGGHGDYYDDYFIHCDNCRLDFHLYAPLGEKYDVESFILRWNTRAK